jgi:type IX secretion system PorP/SprF family membrane protein
MKKNPCKMIFFVLAQLAYYVPAAGQQDAQISLYLRNPLQYNAAHAGTEGVLRTTLIHRAQWVGWEGAPRTQFFSSHAPIFRNRMGVGFSAVNDKSGARGHSEFMGHVAYHFPEMIRGFRISSGLSLGVQSNRYDFSALQVHDLGDPWQEMAYSESAFNAGFGVMAFRDEWYFGLSIPHLIEQSMGFQDTGPVQKRHVYFTAGRLFKLNSALDFRASGLIKKVQGAPMTLDMNAELWFAESLSLGGMMRWKEGFGIQATYRHLMQWRFHYAVDFPLNGLANRNFGSHEIGLTWDFGRKPIAYQSPRYF